MWEMPWEMHHCSDSRKRSSRAVRFWEFFGAWAEEQLALAVERVILNPAFKDDPLGSY
jgi:hypothetical protein